MSTIQDLQQVLSRKQEIQQGDATRLDKQRQSGKLSARDRIAKLLDAGSFVELDTLVAKDGLAEGVVTGFGTVDGRPVYVFSQDFTVMGGSVGAAHARKIVKVLEMAQKCGAPIVGMCDSAGARLSEGVAAMNAYAEIFTRIARLSGVVPTLAMVLGPCVGAAAILPELMDFTLAVRGIGQVMTVGPQIASATLGHTLTAEELGGAQTQAKQGGIHFALDNEAEAFVLARKLLSMLPDNNLEDAPIVEEDDFNRVLPQMNATQAKAIVTALVDHADFVAMQDAFAPQAIVGLGRMGGRTIGIVANNADEQGGLLTADACSKIARFVRVCDCYNIPVISLVNTAGFAVVPADAQASLLKAASQMLYAYAEATTTKLAVIMGNAIGSGYVAMGGKAIADVTYAWPGAVIAPVSAEAAVQIFQKKEIQASTGDPLAARKALAARYAAEVADGVHAAMGGFVDDVIDPADTRKMLLAALDMLASKRDANPPKKHGNLPL